MPLVHSFDPLTQCVSQYIPPTEPYSLMYWCRKAILKFVGLRNLYQIESLPLPKQMKLYVGTISMSDFFIDADFLPPDCHLTRIYPALCLIDRKMVNLKVIPTGSNINTADVRFITSFDEEDCTIVVEEQTKTLADVIQQSNKEGTVFDEEFLWLLMDEMINYISENEITPTTHFGPENIHFLPNRQVFMQVEQKDQDDMTEVMNSAVVYEAPEVLNMENPTTTAFSWSIGCILYECLALIPAFYDPDENNPFSVYMKIMNGELPPEPVLGSSTLKAVIKMCLINDPLDRITLQTMKHMARDHLKAVP